ncbi:tRNA pseudouridine(55) synthase TruB [Clostridium aminobutyricum]|uniref:tRNA pseudouridine synthase B n=1 Tax=Clostridium aminobutyricum TaxID=33953 RepID=A0A939D6U4_CLOAM|nr:tRNA pseudouridine(55) synthase TruB [Clostridium aminobutyricum]MBN7772145.1 tRNA pseudouridine(55) synthase TruB [Clostridium aminobutyricum]
MIKEGIININKPAGYTSHDCVNVIRSLTGIKRIGHTGTLDPMASGVLPVCIGSAARITEYLDLDFKKYRCELLLGLETDTLDIWGQVLFDKTELAKSLISSGKISEETVRSALTQFVGNIMQIPPKYSALKVNGKKLYEYARAGQEIEIKSRRVYIKDIQLLSLNLSECKFFFEVTCSKGTYIRSLCRDIGEIFGCGAAMSALERTASGVFSVEDAVDLEALKKLKQGENKRDPETGKIIEYARAIPDEMNAFVVDVDVPLTHFGKAVLFDNRVKWFCDGGPVHEQQVKILKNPEYKEKNALIEIREEFKNAYNIYREKNGQELFLGVAFHNEETMEFKADKVFGRG